MGKASYTGKYTFGIHTSEADINENFKLFLANLRERKPIEWGILDGILRKYVIPWLCKKLNNSSLSYGAKIQVAEEIYSESSAKYVELVMSGQFNELGNLISLKYSIADRKLKETFRKFKKDNSIVFTDNDDWMHSFEDPIWKLSTEKDAQNELVEKMKAQLRQLSEKDQQILLRFANGERLKEIALSLDVPEATCRKQKERALTRLRKLFFSNASKVLIGITWLINII